MGDKNSPELETDTKRDANVGDGSKDVPQELTASDAGEKTATIQSDILKPEPLDKGIESIYVEPNGDVVSTYKFGAREDNLSMHVEARQGSQVETTKSYFDGRSDALATERTIVNAGVTTSDRTFNQNDLNIISERSVSQTNDSLNETVTRRYADGTYEEFDKRAGRFVRSRKYDANGELIPPKHEPPKFPEIKPPGVPKLPDKLNEGDATKPKPADAVTVDGGTGSADHIKRVQDEIDALPSAVRKLLNQNGYKVHSPEKVVDVRPDLKTTQPRGYPAGETFENTSAMHDGSRKEIIVAEKYLNNGTWYHDNRTEANVRHEAGHAIDLILGKREHWNTFRSKPLSEGHDFTTAYDADVAKIPATDRAKLHYVLQPGNAGKSEAFAEVFAQIHGGASSADPATRALIQKYFTNTERVIRDRIKKL